MFQIPAAYAPLFMGLFFAFVLGGMAWILRDIVIRHWPRRESPPPLAPWEDGYLMDLQFDGRWSRSEGPFERSVEALLYAPKGRAGKTRKKPRVARFSHTNRAFGPWVYDGITRLETKAGTLLLRSRGFSDLPWQFAPQMKLWLVELDGQPFGTLTREEHEIVARDTVGGIAGRWETPIGPGEWRMARPELGDELVPLHTALVLGESEIMLRLPYYDARISRLDFAGQPFLQGTAPTDPDARTWTLAFLAIAAHASLNLQTRTLKRLGQAA